MCMLEKSPNFLGQTPLHLAITQSSVVSALLYAGHPLDDVDIFGLTPLMYAAGLGEINSAKQLISAGADLSIQGGRFQRDFIEYAFARGQSKFIVEIVMHIQSTFPQQASQIGHFYGTRILIEMVSVAYLPWVPVDYVESLVQLAGDIDFTFHDPFRGGSKHDGLIENHLLHYGWRLQHVQVMMESGFSLLDHQNNVGKTALMAAASRGDPMVTRYFVEVGAEVNRRDTSGMSALAHCLWGWGGHHIPFGKQDDISYPEVARILLDAGADPCSTDSCDCACSSAGCTVVHMLPAVFGAQKHVFMGNDDIWTTSEWLHLLGDGQNEELLRSSLIALLRRSLFEESGMTHTCCRLQSKQAESRHSLLFDHDDLTGDEQVTVRAQQTRESEQLDLQMRRMANLSTAELMSQWQHSVFQCHLQIWGMDQSSWHDGLKEWHQNTCDLATHRTKLGPLERFVSEPSSLYGSVDCLTHTKKPSGPYSVNERSDSITQVSCGPHSKPDKVLPFSSSLGYLEKLERTFYEGRAGDHSRDGDAWYKQRLGWALQFLGVLQVPPLYLREGMQGRLAHHGCWLDGKDASNVMKHFLDSRDAIAARKR